MRQATTILRFDTNGRGFTDITRDVADWQQATGISEGLLSLLCRHTSASLMIQENGAPAVRRNLAQWLERLAPDGNQYEHPAHLRATLTGVNLSIPVIGGRLALGAWQGICLAEHRRAANRREVALHLIGE